GDEATHNSALPELIDRDGDIGMFDEPNGRVELARAHPTAERLETVPCAGLRPQDIALTDDDRVGADRRFESAHADLHEGTVLGERLDPFGRRRSKARIIYDDLEAFIFELGDGGANSREANLICKTTRTLGDVGSVDLGTKEDR